MPRTTPLIPDGYYLWVPRSGSLEDKARFGSTEAKTVLNLTGDCYVPDGNGGLRVQRLSREETLAYSSKANVGTMLAAAIGHLLSDEEAKAQVRRYDADWQVILDVPMIVRVESHEWSPKEDETKVYVSTAMKGAVVGWPVGIPIPDAVTKLATLPVPWPLGTPATAPTPAPTVPAAAAAPNPPAPPAPDAQRVPTAPSEASVAIAQPGDKPPQAPPAPVVYPEGWREAYRRTADLTGQALARFGYHADHSPDANAAAIAAFWQYFDGVPQVAALKRYKADSTVTFARTPEAGATVDALDLATDALSRFLRGVDARPPMPTAPVAATGGVE